jgi:thymidylate synthase (FAD)
LQAIQRAIIIMKINQPTFEIWLQEPGLDGVYRQVERAGRVCYKSEDHQTADSARPFAERMIKSNHTAMLEHATVYLTYPSEAPSEAWQKYAANRFSRVNAVGDNHYVTTNLRVLAENQWMDDLSLITDATPHHELRVTVHFTTQIGTTREFNRHRANSMAEQSTRYCNYGKAKFGSEIAVNLPVWVAEQGADAAPTDAADLPALFSKVMDGTATDLENWVFANLAAERAYMNLTAAGRKPQEARAVLPLDTNTELVHTAFVSDWLHFFDLRALGTTGAPHPDAKVLAEPLMREFERLGFLPKS